MTHKFKLFFILWIVILVLLVSGCSGSSAPTPIPQTPTPAIVPTETSEPTAAPSPQPPEVTFEVLYDGTQCTVTGPTEVPIGNYQFILKDLTDEKVDLWAAILDNGKTYQDLIVRQSQPGEYLPPVSWATHDSTIKRGWNEEQGGNEITVMLIYAGEHAIYVGGYDPESLWFCAPIQVIEAPSE